MNSNITTIRGYPCKLKLQYHGHGVTLTWDGFYMFADEIKTVFVL